MTASKKNFILTIAACVIGGSFIFVVVIPFISFSRMTSTVMKKSSPDKQRTAKLIRTQFIDVNFKVNVDGKRVYTSPDFAPIQTDFREQIVWDTNSQIIVLEVAGKRIFGYHVVEKRALTDSEIIKIEFTPFEKLRYEGTLPKDVSEK